MKLVTVFVYGTLKAGEPNYKWLTNPTNGYAKFLSVGQTITKFPLVIGTRFNIPFLLYKPGLGHHISGEIYEIDEKMLSNLDVLEDYPTFYHRDQHEVNTTNAGVMKCWIYYLKKFPENLLTKPFLTEYKNSVKVPYLERSKRGSILAADDLKYDKLI